MKNLILVLLCAALWASPCLAGGVGNQCGLAGTWWGQNFEFQQEYLVTILSIGGGRFSAVVDGVNDFPPYEKFTSWRGEAIKTGSDTFDWSQILFGSLPGAEVPDIFAVRGEIMLVDCDHFDASFDFGAIYAWGQVPFGDDPLLEFPPSSASYTRMPTD